MERPVGLGHLSIGVTDITSSARFYDAALGAIGFVRKWSSEVAVGYGPPSGGDPVMIVEKAGTHPPGPGFHLAFNAADHAAVDAFHAAGIANGGTDNGRPGLRAHYSPSYYAAFLLDPDGWHLEAVHQL